MSKLTASPGLYGIQAARYYLESHPYAKLTIIEGDGVIGGAWSSSTSSVPSLCRNAFVRTGCGMTALNSESVHRRHFVTTKIVSCVFRNARKSYMLKVTYRTYIRCILDANHARNGGVFGSPNEPPTK